MREAVNFVAAHDHSPLGNHGVSHLSSCHYQRLEPGGTRPLKDEVSMSAGRVVMTIPAGLLKMDLQS
jgi:hypothetical protein